VILTLAHHEVLLAAEAAMLSGLSVATLRSLLGRRLRVKGRRRRDSAVRPPERG